MGAQLHGSSFISLISVMITPAIFILGAGSLVASTLTRLARVVDRARIIMEEIGRLRAEGLHDRALVESRWLRTYSRRASLAERALSLYYSAIGLFVASSLAITVDNLTHDAVPWLSLALVVIGAILLFAGTAALVIETNLATGTLQAEIRQTCDGEEPTGLRGVIGAAVRESYQDLSSR
jgi:Protein of unknown function (DUF2721)